MKARWPDAKVLMLIDEYKSRPCLWSPSHPEYKHLTVKNEAWKSLAEVFDIDVEDVKMRIMSLLASLRRERAKERNRTKAGEVYRPRWFAYSSLAFLRDRFKAKDTNNAEEITENPQEELIVEYFDSNSSGCDNIEGNSSTPQEGTVIYREPAALPSASSRRPSAVEPQHPSKVRKLDVEFNEAFDIIENAKESTGTSQRPKTTTDIFAEYVAAKLHGYPDYTRNVVQHKINNILFEADMGTYVRPDSS